MNWKSRRDQSRLGLCFITIDVHRSVCKSHEFVDEFATNTIYEATDAELIMRFVKANDETCFEALVARHSNLVFQVCQTILLNRADAEDAFQATFVVFVRKAKCLLHVNSLAAWLYKVAYRIAIRANRRRKRESHDSLESEPETEIDQFHQISRKEILSGVFDELASLPAKYKEVLVECYLNGRSYRYVAEATDSTVFAVKGRVAQAKKCLRRRLLKRGIALSFVLIMLDQVRSVSVANSLVQSTTAVSLSSLMGESTAKVAGSVQSLTKIGIQKMSIQLLTKPLSVAFVALLATVVPLSWVLNQPVGGQEKTGLKISSTQEKKARGTASTKLSKSADPFGPGGGQRDPFGGSSFGQDPFGGNKKSTTRPANQDPFGSGDDPVGGYPKSKNKATSYKPAKRESKPSKAALPAETEANIEKSLEASAGFEWVDVPLQEVADEIADVYRINVHLDKVAIEDAGYDIEMPMTGRANGRSLRSALRIVFKGEELRFVVKNETLIITTQDAIESKPDDYLVTRIYDVTDLAKVEAKALVEAIEKNVAIDSWGDNGYASISELNVSNKILLVVSHTSENQNEIQTLLENLRKLGSN